jgi:hypothetical protein
LPRIDGPGGRLEAAEPIAADALASVRLPAAVVMVDGDALDAGGGGAWSKGKPVVEEEVAQDARTWGRELKVNPAVDEAGYVKPGAAIPGPMIGAFEGWGG